jgi:acetyl-CoA carboxylase biotin carboxylase subunit
MFNTVLIANRGEIALRVARTCREMGLRTVAVYSTADRDSAVVRFADEAVHIGSAPARASYQNAAAIVEAARKTGAEAIHPGYGFLSEDPDFAEICEAEGLTFVGPPASVLAGLGDKAQARKIMAEAGLPVLSGGSRTLDTAADAVDHAEAIGYPVIIKAAAGGGGRGMAVVRDPRDLPRAYAEVRATGQAVFGDSRVYLERYLETARHVEVQVLADQHGTVLHLGERDCSVQRRRQKLIEETPAPGLAPETSEALYAAAIRGVRATGYLGAGTFEFLVDGDGDFSFMEINCRIQVEHPVTELTSGVDIVREQLRIAAGYPLSVTQSEVRRHGVAIECRINAEDPSRGFVPTPGTVTTFEPPGGPFTRVDTHLRAGQKVTADYDPMLAKVAVWAPDRRQAIARMQRALEEFTVAGTGMHTTIDFLAEVLAHPRFLDGKHTTTLVDQMTARELRPAAKG